MLNVECESVAAFNIQHSAFNIPRLPRTKVANGPLVSRLLFPAARFTVDDAVDYYRRVARWMLPHLRGHPISFKRYPGTVGEESFWEKDAPSFTPPSIH